MDSKMRGSIIVTVGYMLSPLSWWNDWFVNIPIAYVVGLLAGLVSPRAFSAGVIAGYWATNIAGLVLLHKGSVDVLALARGRTARAVLAMNLVVSIVYTGIILLLMHVGVLRLPKKGFIR
ncbi:MAG: hypothetical protein ABR899_03415 [Candidatus Krumholzibacteriaceae bacterium]|jgi:hypothetical protein